MITCTWQAIPRPTRAVQRVFLVRPTTRPFVPFYRTSILPRFLKRRVPLSVVVSVAAVRSKLGGWVGGLTRPISKQQTGSEDAMSVSCLGDHRSRSGTYSAPERERCYSEQKHATQVPPPVQMSAWMPAPCTVSSRSLSSHPHAPSSLQFVILFVGDL